MLSEENKNVFIKFKGINQYKFVAILLKSQKEDNKNKMLLNNQKEKVKHSHNL